MLHASAAYTPPTDRPLPRPLALAARVARRIASGLALGVAVVGSVATSQAEGPVVVRDLAIDTFELGAQPAEHRVHLRLMTARAETHELVIALEGENDADLPVAARIEIEGASEEPQVIEGTAEQWASEAIEVETECDDGGCFFEGDVVLRVTRSDGAPASVPVRMTVSAIVTYSEGAEPGEDDVLLTAAEPGAAAQGDEVQP